ncbi:ECF transporter S component [Streptococcus ovis]|uniref:ECF transporter S component n=1 Tax=Streptococcus ovis TaxID=82806 RepID=UPI0003705F58|nr:ECF transporter S component [Streptococcus ovis]
MTNTRKMAYIAVLSAISFLLMYVQFQILPGVDFLKLDFSIIPILIGLVILDVKSSFIILLIRSALQLLLNNNGPSSMIGMPMNVIAYAFFILALAYIWKNQPTIKSYVGAVLTGTIVLTLAMLVLNYIYAMPMYAAFANFDVAKFIGTSRYLFAMVLPFNFLQGLIFGLVFYPVYRACQPILKKF